MYRQYHEYESAFKELGYLFEYDKSGKRIKCNGEYMNKGIEATVIVQMKDLGFTGGIRRAWKYYARKNRYGGK